MKADVRREESAPQQCQPGWQGQGREDEELLRTSRENAPPPAIGLHLAVRSAAGDFRPPERAQHKGKSAPGEVGPHPMWRFPGAFAAWIDGL